MVRGACALSEYHHVIRITAKLGDVLLNPLHGLDLVQSTPVAGCVLGILGREFGMCKESERAYAVVERYQNYVLISPLLTVKLRLRAPALAHAATEYPDGNGQFCIGLTGFLGPNVQIEAILAVS